MECLLGFPIGRDVDATRPGRLIRGCRDDGASQAGEHPARLVSFATVLVCMSCSLVDT